MVPAPNTVDEAHHYDPGNLSGLEMAMVRLVEILLALQWQGHHFDEQLVAHMHSIIIEYCNTTAIGFDKFGIFYAALVAIRDAMMVVTNRTVQRRHAGRLHYVCRVFMDSFLNAEDPHDMADGWTGNLFETISDVIDRLQAVFPPGIVQILGDCAEQAVQDYIADPDAVIIEPRDINNALGYEDMIEAATVEQQQALRLFMFLFERFQLIDWQVLRDLASHLSGSIFDGIDSVDMSSFAFRVECLPGYSLQTLLFEIRILEFLQDQQHITIGGHQLPIIINRPVDENGRRILPAPQGGRSLYIPADHIISFITRLEKFNILARPGETRKEVYETDVLDSVFTYFNNLRFRPWRIMGRPQFSVTNIWDQKIIADYALHHRKAKQHQLVLIEWKPTGAQERLFQSDILKNMVGVTSRSRSLLDLYYDGNDINTNILHGEQSDCKSYCVSGHGFAEVMFGCAAPFSIPEMEAATVGFNAALLNIEREDIDNQCDDAFADPRRVVSDGIYRGFYGNFYFGLKMIIAARCMFAGLGSTAPHLDARARALWEERGVHHDGEDEDYNDAANNAALQEAGPIHVLAGIEYADEVAANFEDAVQFARARAAAMGVDLINEGIHEAVAPAAIVEGDDGAAIENLAPQPAPAPILVVVENFAAMMVALANEPEQGRLDDDDAEAEVGGAQVQNRIQVQNQVQVQNRIQVQVQAPAVAGGHGGNQHDPAEPAAGDIDQLLGIRFVAPGGVVEADGRRWRELLRVEVNANHEHNLRARSTINRPQN
ncbi:hypothetical protein GQ42DRAFT_162902 [Ramicandelaber brevisporus]|nr:hypothetical protein GQ42DRAFT_162902 [Ramicandelaber brevisporus]